VTAPSELTTSVLVVAVLASSFSATGGESCCAP
jgi:hypothetical protein